MKKHLITTTAAGAVLAMTAPVQASGYVKLFGGINDLSDNKFHFETHNGGSNCVYNSWAGYCTVSGYGSWYGFSTGTVTLTLPNSGLYTPSTTTTPNTVALYNGGATYQFGSHWLFGWTDTYNATDVEISSDSGYVVGASAGKNLGGGLSIEGEIAYRKNDLDAKATYIWKNQAKIYHYSVVPDYFVTPTYIYTNAPGTYTVTTGSAPVTGTAYNAPGTGGYGTYVGVPIPPWFANTVKSVTYHTFASKGPYTKVDSGDITSFSIMANVWYDFCPDETYHPYIGGGVGFAELNVDIAGVDESYSGFAWQAAAGVAFDVSESLQLSIEARFFEVPDAEFDINGQTRPFSYESQEILVGLKFKF